MHIAIVIEHFDPARGGAEKLTVWTARQLAARGHRVSIICHDARERINRYKVAQQASSHDAARSTASRGTPEQREPDNIEIHRLRGMKLNTGMGFRAFGRKARRSVERLQPDVTHSISIAFPGEVYRAEAGIYRGLQEQAIASRESASEQRLKRLMLKMNGKQRSLLALEARLASPPPIGPARIIAISTMERDELAAFYGITNGRVVRLDNPRLEAPPPLEKQAIDRATFRDHYGLGAADRVALFIGHDFRRKGLRWAIDAIALSKSKWKLLVVGLGKIRDYIDHAERRGISERVIFVGPTQQTDLVYAASDALLLPTFYDSFGFVALEALGFGLPVISTKRLGCHAIIEQADVGTIVTAPTDCAAMAAGLDQLPTDPAARQALAARARAAGIGLSGDDYIDRLLGIYADVIAAKP